MRKEELLRQDLVALQKQKAGVCISIIVPTHRISPGRNEDSLQLQKAVRKAKEYLKAQYDKSIADQLSRSIDEVYQIVNFDHNGEGVGLFVSGSVKKLIEFPFVVEEKVIIGSSFEVRDILYSINYSKPYYVLQIEEKLARLFSGELNVISEIKDKNFPKNYQEEVMYDPPKSTKVQQPEGLGRKLQDESAVVEELPHKSFFHEVDESLKAYLVADEVLVVCGAKKEVAGFEDASHHLKKIAGTRAGIYSEKDLPEKIWPIIKSYIDKQKEYLIKEFEEKIGQGLGITGLPEIWQAAKEGRGFILLVEKNYRVPAFLGKDDDYHLFLKPPLGQHIILTDAIDDLMETVLEKGGEVMIVENGMLENYQHMALIARY